jgi:transcriptional regulator with XRE-family HTH domain
MQLPRLKEWRESRGLLQRELASEAALSEFTITRIENGDSIRPSTARKVADALGVSVADLQESPPAPLALAR